MDSEYQSWQRELRDGAKRRPWWLVPMVILVVAAVAWLWVATS